MLRWTETKWQSTFQIKPAGDLDECLVYQGVRSNKMLHRNNEELSRLRSTEIDSNSVSVISRKSMFWYLKKTLQNPANDEKGKPYAGQPYARVCHIWLTISERTLFLPPDLLKTVFFTDGVHANEPRLQCKLKCDALEGSGWFFGDGNGGFDSSGRRRSGPSVNGPVRFWR